MKHPESPPENEFSRIIDVQDLSKRPLELDFKATEGERCALATRFGLDDLGELHGHARLSLLDGSDEGANVLVEATFMAEVTQTCSITLDPVKERIEASFSQVFAPQGESGLCEGDISEDPEVSDPDESEGESEPPEPLVDGKIDLGECVAEEMAVRINPAPRRKGVEFEGVNEGAGADEAAKGPFAELAKLKVPGEPQQ